MNKVWYINNNYIARFRVQIIIIKMRILKLSLLIIANIITISLFAEGYQINSQSARQTGMGHLGTGLKLGAESMLFNPAGLTSIQGKYQISAGVTPIFSKVTFEKDGYKTQTDNSPGTPIFGYFGYKPTDRLALGISITNPAGNSLTWPDDWAGAHHVQNISLAAFSIQPTIAYQISEKLSVGAGLMVNFGNFEINRAITPIGALNPIGNMMPNLKPIIDQFAHLPSVTAQIEGKAGLTTGFNLGIMYSPNEKLTIGLSYRSKVKMSVKEGETSLEYVSPQIKQVIEAVNTAAPGTIRIPDIDGKSFKSSLPVPSNLNLGASYRSSSRLLLAAELQYVGWKAYDKLIIDFGNDIKLVSIKNFKNTMIYRAGAEYLVSEKFIVRAGVIYDTTPVDMTYYHPETPGANKFSATTGFTYNISSKVAFDFGFQALFGEKVSGTAPETFNPALTFGGKYRSTALIPSFGLNFNL